MNLRQVQRSVRARTSKRTSKSHPEFPGFLLLAVSLFGIIALLFPKDTGAAGIIFARTCFKLFGQVAYLPWLFLGYHGFRLVLHQEDRKPWQYLFVDTVFVFLSCTAVTFFGQFVFQVNPGGVFGKFGADFLSPILGSAGAFLGAVFAIVLMILYRFGQRPSHFLSWMWTRVLQDFRELRQGAHLRQIKKENPPEPSQLPTFMSESATATSFKRKNLGKMPEPAPLSAVSTPPAPPKIHQILETMNAKPLATKTTSLASAPPTDSSSDVVPTNSFSTYRAPSFDLLTASERTVTTTSEKDLLASSQLLEQTLATFGVDGKVVEIHPGPIITRFDFSPAPGIKVQSILSLSNDIAMAMRAMSVRIVAPIPGKAAVGIEIPNPKRVMVRLRDIFESPAFQQHPSKLALGLGKDAEGNPYIADLATMPHALIAGSTGSGKSVCIHALVLSLLYRSNPGEVKLVMIDPKRVELPLYNDIPYMFDPNQNPDAVRVITDAKEAAKVLEGMVKVMDHRFKKLANAMARDIGQYNEKMKAEGLPTEPYIVVIIDELADLMAVAAKEVEGSIQRLTQMARAVGIHMILATQRPSVDVITGVIKANLPARIAFRVASQMDSRVILDTIGAESLLGEGDMLFIPPGAPKPIRLQCGYVSTKEVIGVVEDAKAQGKPSYERILSPINSGVSAGAADDPSLKEQEEDLKQALMLVLERRRVSQDLLKAHFGSSARATNLLSLMEVKGFIEKPEGTNRWTIYFDHIDTYLAQPSIPNASNVG